MASRRQMDTAWRPHHLQRGMSAMLEGTLPSKNTQALSLQRVCTPSFKDGCFGAVETQGGAVHTCVPVTFSVPGLGCYNLGGVGILVFLEFYCFVF